MYKSYTRIIQIVYLKQLIKSLTNRLMTVINRYNINDFFLSITHAQVKFIVLQLKQNTNL